MFGIDIDIDAGAGANDILDRPEKPLKWLSEFLAHKSRELEKEVGWLIKSWKSENRSFIHCHAT